MRLNIIVRRMRSTTPIATYRCYLNERMRSRAPRNAFDFTIALTLDYECPLSINTK